MRKAEIDEVVYELEQFYSKKKEELFSNGWSFSTTQDAPESFKELVYRVQNKCIPIADYGSGLTIYSKPYYNYYNRFWHDVTHLKLSKGFSFADETTVILEQCRQLAEAGVSINAQRVFWADMYEQAKYYEDNNEFVNNQKEFVYTNLYRNYYVQTN